MSIYNMTLAQIINSSKLNREVAIRELTKSIVMSKVAEKRLK